MRLNRDDKIAAGLALVVIVVCAAGLVAVAAQDDSPPDAIPGRGAPVERVTPAPAVTVTATTTVKAKPKPRKTVTATATVYRAERASRDGVRSGVGPTEAQWAALRRCESSDNPSAVSGNGLYHGLYQFDLSTWRSVGGSGTPSKATRAEQDHRAHLLYADRGAQPWPICGRHLR